MRKKPRFVLDKKGDVFLRHYENGYFDHDEPLVHSLKLGYYINVNEVIYDLDENGEVKRVNEQKAFFYPVANEFGAIFDWSPEFIEDTYRDLKRAKEKVNNIIKDIKRTTKAKVYETGGGYFTVVKYIGKSYFDIKACGRDEFARTEPPRKGLIIDYINIIEYPFRSLHRGGEINESL